LIPGINRFARNLRGGDARVMRRRIYGDVLPGAVMRCDSDSDSDGGLGHKWIKAMAMSGMRHGHEWNRARAISGAMHGGHIGGAF